MRTIIFAGAMLMAAPAFAQTATPTAPTSPMSPPATVPGAMVGGSPSTANSGPGSTGTVSREGTGAGTITNNPGAANNATNPDRAVPNTGGGGGGSGGK